MNPDTRPVVVIIGGGFAGLEAARNLARAPVRVVVVDRMNHHTFQPLLYQVATAGLSPANIAVPIRSILRDQANAEVVLGNVVRIDAVRKQVVLEDAEVAFDYLVVATGVTHSYFGHDEWERVAPGLKTVHDAVEIRRRILWAFEKAERLGTCDEARPYLTFVVVGGGPTGVEMAGAIAELARHSMASDFRRISPQTARIILLEAGPRLLAGFCEELSRKATASLASLGVEVRTASPLTRLASDHVEAGGEVIDAHTVIWAAGVAGSPLLRTIEGAVFDKAGRVEVAPDLRIPGLDNVFVVGDAAFVRQTNGAPVPGVAPAALQEGRAAARNIARLLEGKSTRSFRYVDKGNMATIGRAAAVAEVASFRMSGIVAWFLWVFVHVLFLIGFRNKLIVLLEWAWAYATFARGSRLIVGEPRNLQRSAKPRADERVSA